MGYPVISVILTAAYPGKWLAMRSSLMQENSTPFEMVFVGPNAPKFQMPENTKFIHTHVNPTQCREIACRAAVGEYVIDLADDYTFVPGYLNSFIEHTKNLDMNKKIIIGHLGHKWKAKVLGKHCLGNPKHPIVGLYALMKRSVWQGLGGLDKRFKAVMCTQELVLRFYQSGGSYILGDTKKCLANEEKFNVLSRTWGEQDGIVLRALWMPSVKKKFTGGFLERRRFELCKFVDENILTENQWIAT